jgi:hypothetical protein
MGREATPEQACHASARRCTARFAFRKQFVQKFNVKAANAKPLLDNFQQNLGFDLRDEKSEFRAHLERVRQVESVTQARCEASLYHQADYNSVQFHRVQAEEWLGQGKITSK